MRAIAVLIDAENVQPSFGDKIFSYAASLGNIVAKEIYGVASALGLWVEPVLKYAIHSNLTIKASKFKNTSDISLVIGAMDLLLKGNVDTVIIVSSDSDFSTLSVRLRLSGLEVIGMGTEKVNPLWRTACTSFVILSSGAQQSRSSGQNARAAAPIPITVSIPDSVPDPVIGSDTQDRGRKPVNASIIPPVTQAVSVQTPEKVSRPVAEQEKKVTAAKKQGTPVIALPEPVKASGNPAVSQPKQGRTRAAATHFERATAIRNFITKNLEMNGGKMSITNIFHVLNNLSDYQVDQQGSKRKPLNYLTWMFSDTFAFEDGMIMFPGLSKEAKRKAEQQETMPHKEVAVGVVIPVSGAPSDVSENGKSEHSDTGRKAEIENVVPGQPVTVEPDRPESSSAKPENSMIPFIETHDAEEKTGKITVSENEQSESDFSTKTEKKPVEAAAEQVSAEPAFKENVEESQTDTIIPVQMEIQSGEMQEESGTPVSVENESPEMVVSVQAGIQPEETTAEPVNMAIVENVGVETVTPVQAEIQSEETAAEPVTMETVENVSTEATAPVQGEIQSEETSAEPVTKETAENVNTEAAAPIPGEIQAEETSAEPVTMETVKNVNADAVAPVQEENPTPVPDGKNKEMPDRSSRNRGGNRSRDGRKKQGEPNGNGKTTGRTKKKAVQKEDTDHSAHGKRQAEGKTNNRNQTANQETSGSGKDRKSGKNTKSASKAQNDGKNSSLESTSLGNIGIQTKPVTILKEHGYRTLADVSNVSNGELLRIKGIGQATVEQIRKSISKAMEK